jgi:hypothetical protein
MESLVFFKNPPVERLCIAWSKRLRSFVKLMSKNSTSGHCPCQIWMSQLQYSIIFNSKKYKDLALSPTLYTCTVCTVMKGAGLRAVQYEGGGGEGGHRLAEMGKNPAV